MGAVFGRAGGSLDAPSSAEWAANAEVARLGAEAERRTGRLLDALAREPGGPVVFHDLRMPGGRENIDHAVLGADGLLLIDTKTWAPGRYWTFAGRTRRGWSRVPHADRRGLPMAVDRVGRFLPDGVVLARPLLVVWPSRLEPVMRMGWYRPAGGARVVTSRSDAVVSRRLRRLVPWGEPDPVVVRRLAELVIDPGR